MFPALENPGLTGALFKSRWWLGRVLDWDTRAAQITDLEKVDSTPQARLTDEDWARHRENLQLPKPEHGPLSLRTINLFSEKTLQELSNSTVHALLHMALTPQESGTHAVIFTVRLAVYVSPRGRLGRIYMALIRPFRYWFVYPLAMGEMKTQCLANLQEQ